MSTEDDNLKFVHEWMELYNKDVHRLVDDLYAEDFEVVLPGLLQTTQKSEFHSIEDVVLEAAPDRRAEIVRAIAKDDTVVVEGESSWFAGGEQQKSSWCAILTVVGGKVTSDHTYIDPTRFPGAAAVLGR
ncbi:nuclear transport factor 2 family protein [Mycobacteroides chelonae]